MTSPAYRNTPLRNRPAIFRTLAGAERWAAGGNKPLCVVMGDADAGEFLAVCPADASRLVRAGYEMVAA